MQRLENLIMNDVQYVGEEMLKLLQNEIQNAVKNFVMLTSPVKVRYRKEDGQLKFMVEFYSDRVRPLGFIPNRRWKTIKV